MTLDIRKVLVPVDFSEVSSAALRYGVSIAEKFGAELVVLTVADDDSAWVVDLSDRVHVKERWREERVAEGKKLLAEFCGPLLGQREYSAVVAIGQAADEIVACCRAEEADLLVIGAHGSSGVVSEWLGGVAYSLSKKAPCPVLVIHGSGEDKA